MKGSAAILFLFGLAAEMFAQPLRRLNLNSSSNHQIIVTWPYTNAGFTFQEAKAISWATNWQVSTLAPVSSILRIPECAISEQCPAKHARDSTAQASGLRVSLRQPLHILR